MDISFFLVISEYLELEIEMYIFFHILIKVEISLLFKLLSSWSGCILFSTLLVNAYY